MEKIMLDSTQKKIYEHLIGTKLLMEKTGRCISGRETNCELITMEDLGISNNTTRMSGGFFTGMYLHWDCDRYFIPVDATVNACGVSIYELNDLFTNLENFRTAINETITSMKKDGIKWNYNSGNHFISLCIMPEDTTKQYLILHASDNKYKFGNIGLYPDESSWFFNQIRTFSDGDRYLRYITDDTAERFYALYLEAEKENPLRNDEVAKRIAGDNIRRILYSPHYGMPDKNSIAIGCQWNPNYVILTSFGKNIYQVKLNSSYDHNLVPHGFGVSFKNEMTDMNYNNGKLYFNGKDISLVSNGFLNSSEICYRYYNQKVDGTFIINFLKPRDIEIIAEFKQLYSYNRNGFAVF